MKIHMKCCCGAEINLEWDRNEHAPQKTLLRWEEKHKDCKAVQAPSVPVIVPPVSPWTGDSGRPVWTGTAGTDLMNTMATRKPEGEAFDPQQG